MANFFKKNLFKKENKGQNDEFSAPSGPGSNSTSSFPDDLSSLDKSWTEIDGPIARQVTAIVIGGGLRGTGYAYFAADFPSRLKIVGVAEPKPHRLKEFQKLHKFEDKYAVADWKDLANVEEKLADIAIITTQDRMHKDPAIAFAKKGYHLLLEKPVSVYETEVEEIAKVCLETGVLACVCHVLRYFPPCVKIRDIIREGTLGTVVQINHVENILFWHFAHSFVRGNWRKENESSFSLLAKCCHDIDLIKFWMGEDKCTKIQSFGGLRHFKKSEQPKGATSRCFDCSVENDCPYSVQKVYLRMEHSRPSWPMSAVCDIEDHPKGYYAALREELEKGPYGRCVYECDNDVVDHQSVNMQFESGATVNMTMNAFTRNMSRNTVISGSKGELRWNGKENGGIFVYDFATQSEKEYFPDMVVPPARTRGHGGADFFLVNSFVKAVASGDRSLVTSGIEESLASHKLVFAAERSRLNDTVETL